jgi:tetratricopeptide (TPR) repeat protein
VAIPLLWVSIAIAPYLFPGLLRMGATAILADRYLYFASFGFAWALVLLVFRLPRLLARFTLAAVVALYGIVSFSLCLNYLDEAEYWAFASRQNPSSVLAAHNHAWGLWKEHEDFIGARLEFHRMLRLAPDFDYGICSFAQMHAEENDPESALNLLDSSLRRRPESMHLNRQRALIGSLFGDDEARTLKCFRKAAALGADDGSFHFGWAEYLKELLDWKNAAREFRIAGERNPFFSEEAQEARFLLQNPPIKPGGRILVIGDSIPHGTGTKGEGDNEERSLAVALCGLFLNASDNLVVDASVPGSLAGDLEEQLDKALESVSGGSRTFSLCIVLTGHNDAFADASSFEILGCLAETALECRRRGIVPVLVGPIHVRDEPERPRNRQEKVLSALDRKLASFCSAAGITYVSAREALGANDLLLPTGVNYDKNSGNHLSRTGIGKLAEEVRAAIRPLWIEEFKRL